MPVIFTDPKIKIIESVIDESLDGFEGRINSLLGDLKGEVVSVSYADRIKEVGARRKEYKIIRTCTIFYRE